jgi:Holliday junction DNA helicase RuvA
MIGRIKGTLVEVEGNVGLIETASGVFYEVYLTTSLLASHFPPSPIEVRTYLHVREDILRLFGFKTNSEYKLFTMLLDVPGVGPKSAFSIISFTKIDELVAAIKTNDAKYFTKIPGLGKKTALKIILELATKFDSEFTYKEVHLSEEDKTAVEALVALGFKATDVKMSLEKLPQDLGIEEKIRESIKLLSGNK